MSYFNTCDNSLSLFKECGHLKTRWTRAFTFENRLPTSKIQKWYYIFYRFYYVLWEKYPPSKHFKHFGCVCNSPIYCRGVLSLERSAFIYDGFLVDKVILFLKTVKQMQGLTLILIKYIFEKIVCDWKFIVVIFPDEYKTNGSYGIGIMQSWFYICHYYIILVKTTKHSNRN